MPPDLDDVLDELIAIHRETGRPVATAPELAERLGENRRTVHDRLRLLEARQDVASHEIGRGRAWWAVHVVTIGPPAEPPAAPLQEPSAEPPQEPAAEETDAAAAIERALEDWSPGRSREDRLRRREAGKQVLEWLRENEPGRYQGQDIREAIGDELSFEEQNLASWWEKLARPALKHAAEAGLVEYREGYYDYRWVGP